MRAQERLEIGALHRPPVEESLAVLTAAVPEQFLLLLRLDALADDAHAERVAEVDHHLEHDAHALGFLRGEQQRAVDLHDIERQLVEQ